MTIVIVFVDNHLNAANNQNFDSTLEQFEIMSLFIMAKKL